MASKRKRGDEPLAGDIVSRPVAGTRSFQSGAAVRDGLAVGTRQALVSFHQQIVTPYSALPLAIAHPTVLILQHYLDVSPTADEIFNAWKQAEEGRNEKLAESSALLLALIIKILTPLPFFHTQLVGIVSKLLAPNEPYNDLLGRLLQSGKREHLLAGLALAAAAVHVDTPDPANLLGGSARGRLASRVWASLVEGGSVKVIGKALGMRRRTKEGSVEYSDRDPLDRADIRHLAIHLVLPLLPTQAFHTHAKGILQPLYAGLAYDPPLTIYRVLTAMWTAISGPPPGVARRIALVLLDESAVDHIARLLERNATEPETGRSIAEIVEGFLEGVTATPGRGICFPDEGWYPREEEESATDSRGKQRNNRGLHNRILSNVVKRLGARVVDDEGRVGAWVLKMFESCPELVHGYWAHSALSLDPRLDAKWIATMAYIGRVISLPLPGRGTFNQPAPRGTDAAAMPPRPQPPLVTTIVESVLPSPMTKAHLSKGLQHNSSLVQHVTALALARGLQKLASVQQLFASISAELEEGTDGPWASRARELEIECRRRVPEVPVVIAFAQKAATMARPVDEDDEIEPSLAARSAMLTEAALRLFRLYHKTLPGLAGEARFDVGKLLVSASSANAERRARREAREGSVVSDSGSVGSVGTLGTVGMGGGFGHTRGDVEGFEALSQLHVLRLLSEVRDWSWVNKAAGSQYTYLYHILQLHLSTRNVVTQAMTTTLLHRLLQPSLLFEHDTLELPVWLDAMPRTSDTVSGPFFVAEQIHLLSFIDECVRRALKTPHRYIEEAADVVPELSAQAVASPLLLTMVEQLHAKLLGMHIATEAAAVVLNYLRRVLVGLLGKQANATFVRAIVERLTASVTAARDAGQPRHGLAEIIDLINADLSVVFDCGKLAIAGPETPKLVDEADWAERSFVRKALARFNKGSEEKEIGKLAWFVNTALPDESARQAQFMVHFVTPKRGEDQRDLLRLLSRCLERASGTEGTRLKSAVFNDESVRDLFLTPAGDDFRAELASVAATLSPKVQLDAALAEHYAHATVATVEGKAADASLAFAALEPWVPFLSAQQVDAALAATIKRATKAAKKAAKGKAPATAADVTAVLGKLVTASKPAGVYSHLPALLNLGAYRPVSALLRGAVATSLSRRLDVEISADIVTDLVSKADDDAYILLALLVSLSTSASSAFAAALEDHPAWLEDVRLLPALASVEVPAALGGAAAKTAVDALANPVLTEDIYAAARALLCAPSLVSHADAVNAAIARIPFTAFSLPLAQTLVSLANTSNAALTPAITAGIDLGLQWTTRLFSDEAELAGAELATFATLGDAVRAAQPLRVEVNPGLAEPAITAAVTERLDVPEALELAALLSSKAMLKAGFVRSQLQALVSSKTLLKLCGDSAEPAHRLAFVRLLHALFHASTYVSCQPNFIEPLVPLYRGSLSQADRLVLSLFQTFETQRKVSVTSVLKHWAPGGTAASGRALDALTSLDAQRVFATCSNFPLRRAFTAAPDVGDAPDDEDTYDPVFVLALFTATLQEELTGLDWVEILRSNVLGLAVCSLSSRDLNTRTVAAYVLSKATELVAAQRFHEQLQLLHTLELVMHALPEPVHGSSSQPRLPTLIALFVAHALRALAHPAHFLYPLASRFLLQRPTMDAGDVPALYGMLYAAADGARRQRAWIVRLLRDGVKSNADYRILARRNTFALLASLFQSSLDPIFRRHVLGAMSSIAKVPTGARALLRGSLVPWLSSQWDAASGRPNTEEVRSALVSLLEDAVAASSVESDKAPRWAVDAALFLTTAARDADAERLEQLARVALRVAVLGGEAAATVPALVGRLEAVGGSDATTELLFRLSLEIRGGVDAAVVAAVKVLSARVAQLEGSVGEWARSEARRV